MNECILHVTGLPMTREPDRDDGGFTIRCEDPFKYAAKVAARLGLPEDTPGSLERYTAVMLARESQRKK